VASKSTQAKDREEGVEGEEELQEELLLEDQEPLLYVV
jgi:hypothetical protein